jgi:hypothetical protein
MPWWILLVLVILTWCLWAVAAAAERAASEAAEGVPESKRGGVSIAPVIPLFPLAAFGVAVAADAFFAPWGTRVVGGLHGLLATLFVLSIVRDWVRLRRSERAD